jgi:uncharacterized membrane protein
VKRLIPGLAGLALAAGFSLWAYSRLPGEVATHWGIDGRPDGWSSPGTAAVLMPTIGLVLALVFLVLPRIDPRREGYRAPGNPYWVLANAILVLLALIHVVMLGYALGWAVNATKVAIGAVGVLFALLGYLMPKMQPSWFVGIRTPWTLSDDEVWVRTHRMGGKLFLVAGALIVAAALLGGNWWMVGAFLVAVGIALVPVVYSWWLWRERHPGG